MERFRLERGERTESTLRNILQRVRRDFDTGTNLVNEAQSFLERGWLAIRREELESHDGESSTDRERLTELLRELAVVASRINNEIGNVASAKAATSPAAPPKMSPFVEFEEARFARVEDYQAGPAAADSEPWADALAVAAGPWTLRLTGAAVPTPELVVSLHGNRVGTSQVDQLLTLVRPSEGFEPLNLDSFGRAKVALPAGDSVMLLQGEEVWQVRLSFQHSPTS